MNKNIKDMSAMKNVISVDSNSKSEDTPKCKRCGGDGFTSEHGCNPNYPESCAYTCPVQVQCEACEATGLEPPQDTVSMEDIMHATPKGREVVMKAIENSIEVQNKMTKKAQNTLKESNNLNTSEEHIKDTSLDFIGCCGGGLARHEVCSHVKAYIKAQQAKLLQVIEDELPKKGELKGKGYFGYNKRQNESLGNQIVGAWDDAIDEVKEILKQIKERYE